MKDVSYRPISSDAASMGRWHEEKWGGPGIWRYRSVIANISPRWVHSQTALTICINAWMHASIYACMYMRISVNKQSKSNNIYACLYDMFVSGHSVCWRMGSWGNRVRNLVSHKEDKLSFFYSKSLFCATRQSKSMFIHVYVCKYSFCIRVGSGEDRVWILVCQCTIKLSKNIGMDGCVNTCMHESTYVCKRFTNMQMHAYMY